MIGGYVILLLIVGLAIAAFGILLYLIIRETSSVNHAGVTGWHESDGYWICKDCGISHKHSRDKHRLIDLNGVDQHEIDSLYWNPDCHCGFVELKTRWMQEGKIAETGDQIALKHGTTPIIPEKVYRDLCERYDRMAAARARGEPAK